MYIAISSDEQAKMSDFDYGDTFGAFPIFHRVDKNYDRRQALNISKKGTNVFFLYVRYTIKIDPFLKIQFYDKTDTFLQLSRRLY